ncbi:MAG TPA: GntR family transcriptional regulator [Herbaspirillum sp.]|uniref:GntR family transcriptional regulator n=1 Tax=Herbaspirillum sp. TaxID=1890675 RepID=UPI002D26102F|nr:GntR family transcriptional regulator [Herbaspirillum sp.]HZG20153.1 GntR family transcriptional regulator [Herbaspirillum sp.]
MLKIDAPAQLIEQVYHAILDAICTGTLAPNSKITQEGLAEQLGVSRQPILQAFQILRREGFITDAGRKGVMVTALDPQRLLQLYQVRAVLDGLAARDSAAHCRHDVARRTMLATEGRALIAAARAMPDLDDLSARIRADMDFHQLLYRSSGNPVIAETTALHWHHIRRAMGAILAGDVRSHRTVWDEHEAILQAVLDGQPALSDKLARQHAEGAAEHLARALGEARQARQQA